jgi:glycogen operon protein
MLLGGDEFGRTQRGNNNAYCQDNETSWYDWGMAASPEGRALTEFVARLIALRQEHAALRSRHFLHGKREPAPGVFDIGWFDENGESVSEPAWKNGELRLLVLRRATGNADGSVSILSVLLNPIAEDHYFRLPPPVLPGRILIDSARPDASESEIFDNKVAVPARSAVLTYARLEGGTQ